MMMMAGGLRLVVACLLLGGATSVEELLDLTYPQREARYRQLGVIPFRDLTSEGMWASSRFSCERVVDPHAVARVRDADTSRAMCSA